MNQFQGMSYDEIRLRYYTAYRRNSICRAIGSKEEAEWIKSNEEHMKAAKERVKRSKTRQKSIAKKSRIIVHESSTESENEKEKGI